MKCPKGVFYLTGYFVLFLSLLHGNESNAIEGPVSPGMLQATVEQGRAVVLTWTSYSDTSNSFDIMFAREAGRPFEKFVGVDWEPAPAGQRIRRVTSLKYGKYYFYVLSRVHTGEGDDQHFAYSDPSNTVSVQLDPPVPQGLTPYLMSGSQVELKWLERSQGLWFEVERSSDNTAFMTIITTTGDRYVDTGLEENSVYKYRVRSACSDGNAGKIYSAYSDIKTISTILPATPPAAPSGLLVSASGSDSVVMSWLDNAQDELGYKIEILRNGEYHVLAVVPHDSASYAHFGLEPATYYSYRVYAFNGAGMSCPVAGAAYTPQWSRGEAPPSGLTAKALYNKVTLNWIDNMENETGYRIERAEEDGIYSLLANTQAFAGGAGSYVDMDVSESTCYFYRVSAVTETEISPYSNTVSICTALNAPLSAPTLSYMSREAKLTVAWADNSGAEEGYGVEICRNGDEAFTDTGIRTQERACVLSGISDFGATYVRVYAYNAKTRSSYSPTAKFERNCVNDWSLIDGWGCPAIYFDADSRAVVLKWEHISPGTEEYKVYRYHFNEEPVLIGTVPKTTGQGGYFLDFSLLPPVDEDGNPQSEIHRYFIEAHNDIMPLRSREAVCDSGIYYWPGIPPVESYPVIKDQRTPRGLTALVSGQNGIQLSWSNAARLPDRVYVYRGQVGEEQPAMIADLPPEQVSYLDKSVTDGQEYYYFLRAFYGSTLTLPCMAALCKAPALLDPPSGLQALSMDTGDIRLSWTDNALSETGYRITYYDVEPDLIPAVPCQNPSYPYPAAAEPFKFLASVGAGVTTFVDTSVPEGKARFYAVEAVRAMDGKKSGKDYVVACAKPLAPTEVQAVWSTSEPYYLTVRWKCNSKSAQEYYVSVTERGVYPSEKSCVWNYAGPSGTSCSQPMYIKYGSFDVTVKARVNHDILLPLTVAEESVSSTLAVEHELRPPANVTAAAVSDSAIDITWDNASATSLIEIEQSEDNIHFGHAAFAYPSAKKYTVTGLRPGTAYYFRLKAMNNHIASRYSLLACAVTLTADNMPPIRPSSLNIYQFDAVTMTLQWWDNARNEDGYTVQRMNASGVYETIASLAVNACIFNDNGPYPGAPEVRELKYRICAFNKAGASEFVYVSAFLKPIALTGAPGDLSASIVQEDDGQGRIVDSVTLSWRDNCGLETGYEVDISPDGLNFTPLPYKLNKDSVTWYLKGQDRDIGQLSGLTWLPAGGKWYFKVRGYNSVDYTAHSNAVCVTTRLSQLRDVHVQERTKDSARISWEDMCGNEKGFAIDKWIGGDFERLAQAPPGTTSFTDTGLEWDVSYRYKIYAFNHVSTSDAVYVDAGPYIPESPVLELASPAKGASLPGEPVIFTTEYLDGMGGRSLSLCMFYFVRAGAAGDPVHKAYYDNTRRVFGTYTDAMTVDLSKTKVTYKEAGISIDWCVTFNEAFTGQLTAMIAVMDQRTVITKKPKGLWAVKPSPVCGHFDEVAGHDIVTYILEEAEEGYPDRNGTWIVNSNGWSRHVSGLVPERAAAANVDGQGTDELVVDYGTVFGESGADAGHLWIEYSSGHRTQICGISPVRIICGDMNADGRDEIACDFGSQYGIWVYYQDEKGSGRWVCLTSLSCYAMTMADADHDKKKDIVINFGNKSSAEGSGIWAWMNDSSWRLLYRDMGIIAQSMCVCDMNGDSIDELVLDFGQHGVYKYDPAAPELSALSEFDQPENTRGKWAVGDVDNDGLDDMAYDLGDSFGIWLKATGTGAWAMISDSRAYYIVTGDINGDDKQEIVMDFGGLAENRELLQRTGMWVWTPERTWINVENMAADIYAGALPRAPRIVLKQASITGFTAGLDVPDGRCEVYLRQSGDGNVFKKVFESPSGTLAVIGGCEPGKQYEAFVRAILTDNGGGLIRQADSAHIYISTIDCPCPWGLTAVPKTDGTVQLSWRNMFNGQTGVAVRILKYGGLAAQSVVEDNTVTLKGCGYESYTTPRLEESVRYGFIIYPVITASPTCGRDEYGPGSAEAVAVTFAAPPSECRGYAVSGTRIDIEWSDNSSNESGYMVEKRNVTLNGQFQVLGTGLPPDAEVFSDLMCDENTVYEYRVASYNSQYIPSYSDKVLIAADQRPSVKGLSHALGEYGTYEIVRIKSVYTDVQGAQDIGKCFVKAMPDSLDKPACFAYYDAVSGGIFLRDHEDTSWVRVNGAGSNGYCVIYADKTTITEAGNDIIIEWVVSFTGKVVSEDYDGSEISLFADVIDRSNQSQGMKKYGGFIVWNAAPRTSLTGNTQIISACGEYVCLEALYEHPDGAGVISHCEILIGDTDNEFDGDLKASYSTSANLVYLMDQTGQVQSFQPGTSGTADGRTVKIDCSGTTVERSGTSWKIKWKVSFIDGNIGQRNIYLQAITVRSTATGEMIQGTWKTCEDLPAMGININAGLAFTPKRAVSLNTTGNGDTAGWHMRFSNEGSDWSAWEPYARGEKAWTLSRGNGAKTVYAQFKDSTGNVLAGIREDAIELNYTTPIIAVDMTGDAKDDLLCNFSRLGTMCLFSSEDKAWHLFMTANARYMAGKHENVALDLDLFQDSDPDNDCLSGIWLKNDTGAWQLLTACNSQGLTLGDMNGDGRNDVIGNFPEFGGVWAYYSGHGWVYLGLPACRSMAVCDLDNDGFDDLTADFKEPHGVWAVLFGNAGVKGYVKLNSLSCEWIECGDVDGDGMDEVVADCGTSGLMMYAVSQAGGSYISSGTGLSGTGTDSLALALADIDGDGDRDILSQFMTEQGPVVRWMADAAGKSWADWLAGYDCEYMATGESTLNRKHEVIIDINSPGQGASGIWIKYDDTDWAGLTDVNAG